MERQFNFTLSEELIENLMIVTGESTMTKSVEIAIKHAIETLNSDLDFETKEWLEKVIEHRFDTYVRPLKDGLRSATIEMQRIAGEIESTTKNLSGIEQILKGLERYL